MVNYYEKAKKIWVSNAKYGELKKYATEWVIKILVLQRGLIKEYKKANGKGVQQLLIFLDEEPYLPSETPEPLLKYRENELATLRGDGTGKREAWDRVYDYDFYNDLGDLDKGEEHVIPILGGSSEYPYPRRGRTRREPTRTDLKSESRILLLLSLDIYVPRDECFGHLKLSDHFSTYGLKSMVQLILPELYYMPYLMACLMSSTVLRMYLECMKDGLSFLKEFPPKSKLDPEDYGNQDSAVTKEQIEDMLDGLTVELSRAHKETSYVLTSFKVESERTAMSYWFGVSVV